MAAAPIYGSVAADDAVRATFMVLSSKRRQRQLAAGAIALLGLFAVNSALERDAADARYGINSDEAAQSCPAVFGYDVVAYHLNEVRPSQAGVPGSSEYSASLSTSYGTYVFWFQNNHNRDLFVEDPWGLRAAHGRPLHGVRGLCGGRRKSCHRRKFRAHLRRRERSVRREDHGPAVGPCLR